MTNVFHQPANSFMQGISVSGGVVTDSLIVNGVTITGSGGGGGTTVVVDNLGTPSITSALSANQGVVLKGYIDEINASGALQTVTTLASEYATLTSTNANGVLGQASISELQTEINSLQAYVGALTGVTVGNTLVTAGSALANILTSSGGTTAATSVSSSSFYFTATTGTSMTVNTQLVAGSLVKFTGSQASSAGLIIGDGYYILSSSGNTISLGSFKTGPAIAFNSTSATSVTGAATLYSFTPQTGGGSGVLITDYDYQNGSTQDDGHAPTCLAMTNAIYSKIIDIIGNTGGYYGGSLSIGLPGSSIQVPYTGASTLIYGDTLNLITNNLLLNGSPLSTGGGSSASITQANNIGTSPSSGAVNIGPSSGTATNSVLINRNGTGSTQIGNINSASGFFGSAFQFNTTASQYPIINRNLNLSLCPVSSTGTSNFWIGNAASGASGSSTINIGDLGDASSSLTTTINIGSSGTGSGTATINIGTATNSSVNYVNIGQYGDAINIQGDVTINNTPVPTIVTDANFQSIHSVSDSAAPTVLAVKNRFALYLPLAGGTLSGSLISASLSSPSLANGTTGAITIGNSSSGVITIGNSAGSSAININNQGTSSGSTSIGNLSGVLTAQGSTINLNSASISLGSSTSSVNLMGIALPLFPLVLGGCLSDETTTVTSSASIKIMAPFTFKISNTKLPIFYFTTAPTFASGTLTFDVVQSGSASGSVYSTKPTVASASTSTSNGSIAGVKTITSGDFLLCQVSGTFPTLTAGAGLKVYIYPSY